MSPFGGAHVDAAVGEMVAVLAPRSEDDWGVRAGSLDWSCRETAAHVAHDLAAYAVQVAARGTAGYLPVDLVTSPDARVPDLLRVVEACGRLLRLAVDSAGPGPVAWHWGMSDAAGFAALGVAEVLVHTFDIAQGLGVAWRPPEPLSRLVVDRLVPDAASGPAPDVLLWATGRTDLPGRPRVTEWVWRAALP
jgi:uncharacterized protein (TIGR03083 family)